MLLVIFSKLILITLSSEVVAEIHNAYIWTEVTSTILILTTLWRND